MEKSNLHRRILRCEREISRIDDLFVHGDCDDLRVMVSNDGCTNSFSFGADDDSVLVCELKDEFARLLRSAYGSLLFRLRAELAG
jgi:hypothetical protein